MKKMPGCLKKQHLLTVLIKEHYSHRYNMPTTTILRSIPINSLFNLLQDAKVYIMARFHHIYVRSSSAPSQLCHGSRALVYVFTSTGSAVWHICSVPAPAVWSRYTGLLFLFFLPFLHSVCRKNNPSSQLQFYLTHLYSDDRHGIECH